ncbi:MAG: imidazoleglycerol-phosphate dehydratase HisB [Eubacterium sp.]|nr:imidazoleglycerol-phosphate dehydratase HisB [Eubacterium sp.]
MADRIAEISRKTGETDITIKINLDGKGDASSVDTGIGFFDHMLKSFAKHGFFDLEVAVKGDLYVDSHHTIEDTGIVLGKAIKKAVGDKAGIRRYGSFAMPMDETLVLCAVDLSGRPYYSSDIQLTVPRVGYFDTEMFKEFFYAVSYAAEMNLHFKQLSGENNHHIIEAAFKAFANALSASVQRDPRLGDELLSTKGAL